MQWSKFCTASIASDLLHTAFEIGNEPLLRTLLKQGIPLVHNGVIRSTVQRMCAILYESAPERYKTCARVVLKYCPAEVLEATKSVHEELALIHQARSPWLLDELLLCGADPNMRAPLRYGNSPALVYHLLDRSPAIALQLLTKGADPKITDNLGINAMHAASAGGYVNVLQAIHRFINLPGDASWYTTCNFRYQGVRRGNLNCLELGALCGHLSCIKFLLDNVDAEKLKTSSGAWDAIYLAAIGGHGDVIRYLQQLNFDISIASPPQGHTPLHVAALQGSLPTVETLIQLGALLMEDRQGLTPLDLAYTSNHHQVAELLEQSFPDSSGRAGAQSQSVWSGRKLAAAFEEALTKEDIHACKNLKQLGHPIDGEISCGCSNLAKAFRLKKYDIARWLVNEDASLTRRSCITHDDSTAFEIWLRRVETDLPVTDLLPKKYIQQGGNIFQSGLFLTAAKSQDAGKLEAVLGTMEAFLGKKRNGNLPTTASDVISQLGGMHVVADAHRAACMAGSTATANLLADYIASALPGDEPCPPSVVIPIFTGDWRTRTAGAKFRSTSFWESRGVEGRTPLLTACSRLPLEVITFLQSRSVDLTKTDNHKISALHIAASKNRLDVFSMLVRSGVSPYALDSFGVSPMILAMVAGGLTTFILHHGIEPSRVPPIPWTRIRVKAPCQLLSLDFKRYLRKFGKQELGRITNLHPKEAESPLCRFTLTDDVKILGKLLELGAEINHEGSPEGSALMLACASGLVASVKFLVRRGAILCYQTPDGQYRSALAAAKGSASITHWLLVGRFIEQPKLAPPVTAEQAEEATRCWSGGAKAEYLLMGANERRAGESSLGYYTRLMGLKKGMRGEVVPPVGNGKTTRPSKLIPVETVRRHPEDKRAPLE